MSYQSKARILKLEGLHSWPDLGEGCKPRMIEKSGMAWAANELSMGCLTEYYHSVALKQAEDSHKIEFSSSVLHVRRSLPSG